MTKHDHLKLRLMRRADDIKALYDDCREAKVGPEVLRSIATAYLNIATAAVDMKKALANRSDRPELRVVK